MYSRSKINGVKFLLTLTLIEMIFADNNGSVGGATYFATF